MASGPQLGAGATYAGLSPLSFSYTIPMSQLDSKKERKPKSKQDSKPKRNPGLIFKKKRQFGKGKPKKKKAGGKKTKRKAVSSRRSTKKGSSCKSQKPFKIWSG